MEMIWTEYTQFDYKAASNFNDWNTIYLMCVGNRSTVASDYQVKGQSIDPYTNCKLFFYPL